MWSNIFHFGIFVCCFCFYKPKRQYLRNKIPFWYKNWSIALWQIQIYVKYHEYRLKGFKSKFLKIRIEDPEQNEHKYAIGTNLVLISDINFITNKIGSSWVLFVIQPYTVTFLFWFRGPLYRYRLKLKQNLLQIVENAWKTTKHYRKEVEC